jgi:pimeloyl-ACP methyl ester carboxylesterase
MTTVVDPIVSHVTSRDGTRIGYWTTGEGPPLLLVHGLLGDHTRWAALQRYLEPHLTVHAMDRRGRGASGDASDHDVTREVEDVAAVIDDVAEAAGIRVDVYGSSGGASYALNAAALTSNIGRLVLFEPPAREVLELLPAQLLDQLDALLAAGDRDGVLVAAYRAVVGLSDEEIHELQAQPAWPNRLAAAHTVPRELRVDPDKMFVPEKAAAVTVPTLVLVGSDSPAPFRTSADTVASTVPDARLVVLEGHGHGAELFGTDLVAEQVLAFVADGR